MQRQVRFGPVALSATLTTNVLNPPTLTGGAGLAGTSTVRFVLTHLHVVNKTAGAVTFSLWLGATGANAAGTELFNGKSVAANDVYDWYGELPFDAADFLVGGASAGTSLTVEGEGYLYIA